MRRRDIFVFAVVATLGVFSHQHVIAHAALRLASPVEGATLGDTPRIIQLSFLENPEPSLSIIRVLDRAGASYETGRPSRVPGDPLSLTIPVRTLDTGVYLVSWRIVSAIDGHVTGGVYAFGVRMSPAGTAAPPASTYPPPSRLEMVARWLFLVGLAGLLGAAAAGVAGFGGSRELVVGAAAWLLTAAGVLLLADAQRRNAATSFAELLATSVGRALIWRSLSLGTAGIALALARWSSDRMRRIALGGAALAALAAMVAHVAAGHAAAGRWPLIATVGAQSGHFAAVGVWLGGLVALLAGTRGAPSAITTAAVRRFSTLAAGGLVVVAGTGVVRAVSEISSWTELASTNYGRVLLVKAFLLLLIASLGALNRWRSVPVVAADLRPLRRTAGSELAVATIALAATAVLGTLPPPSASPRITPLGITVSGTDFARSVRVDLTTGSDEPGPNRFIVHAVDYDSKSPTTAKRITLQFMPLDDPGTESTSLVLAPGPGDSYVGSGANLAFDGRWKVNVIVERARDSTEVPLELETRTAPRLVTVQRLPDRAPTYTVELFNQGLVEFSPDPERPGPTKMYVSCYDFLRDPRMIDSIVITAATAGPAHDLPVRRLDRYRFVGDVELQRGHNTIVAVVRTSDGARLRARIVIDLPHP